MRYILFGLFGFLLFVVIQLSASIINTKHNLSISGTGTVKAISDGETEVCVFCHVPHHAQAVGKPLWNRSMPTTDYVMYDSNYLRRMGYPAIAADLGSANDTPGALSRQCLSCHDGTIAVGAVSKLRYDYDGTTIAMSGVDPDGTIIDTATSFIGADLSHHHPVGAVYDTTISKVFGTGTRGSELKTTIDAPIKLYEYAGYTGKYVECSTCHDPHKENGKFLHISVGTHGANVYATCTACHEKTNWTTGIHATATNEYSGENNMTATYGTNTVASLGCINCHKPHSGTGKPYLLRKVEENTCFQGAGDGTTSTVPCHGTNGAKDIQSVITRTFSHPVTTTQGQHSNLDVLYGTNVLSDGGTGVTWASNKHAECADCHNPHQAKAGSHTPAGQWYPTTTSSTTNAVSNPLKGVTGVDPTWPGVGWNQPTTFTTLESATKEYQICFKCHSYWGLGSASNGVSGHTITSEGVLATDQAFEFNPRNRSAHPVVMTTNEMKAYGGNTNDPVAEGRYAPPLTAAALKSPWNLSPGNQTMMCSDCHGAETEDVIGGDPKGPHGSSKNFMLKGMYKNWPDGLNGSGTATTGGKSLFTMADGQSTSPGTFEIFCLNCHNYKPTDGSIAVHSTTRSKMQDAACVDCHVVVPHGSNSSRLIGYASLPAPYNYGGNRLSIQGIRVTGASNLDTGSNVSNNAYSTNGNCATGSCHGTKDGSYDGLP